MKFYIIPSFCSTKFYYSFYSSFLFILLGFYFIMTKRATKPIQYTLIFVGVISTIHHCRSFSDEYNDIFRLIDISCACLLAFLILYVNYTMNVLFVATCIVGFFLYIQNSNDLNSEQKSLYHGIFHIIVCLSVFFLYRERTCCLQSIKDNKTGNGRQHNIIYT